MDIQNILEKFAFSAAEKALTYAVFAFPFFLAFWVLWKNKFQARRIQEVERATTHHFKHDLMHSFNSFIVFGLMDLMLLFLKSKGYSMVYFDVQKYGLAWIPASFLILVVINDAFFYWSHYAMHHPTLYKFFHRVHHESTDPSPLTSFAFHPSEAVVENFIGFVLPLFLPLHFGVILVWQIFDMLQNVTGHLGYELYPQGWTKHPITKWFTTSTHHNMHHQLFNGNYGLYFTWWDKLMKTEFKDYSQRHEQIYERKNIKRTKEGLYTLTVKNIKNEPNDAVTIEFDRVPSLFKTFPPGQHITIKKEIDGEPYYRTFSLSSVPSVDDGATLTVKRIKGGKVTNYLADNLKIGDTIDVTAPSGQFFLHPEPANRKNYLMIAGGSGITPIYSMVGSILHFEPKSKITLLYANRTSDNIIFKDTLNAWAKKFPTQLEIRYFLSEEENPQNAVRGFINENAIKEALVRFGNQSNVEVYLCGPEAMTTALIKNVEALGVPSKNIHRELFAVGGANEVNTSAKAHITAKVFGKSYQFDTNGKQTILQSALAQNIPLPYSCQSGLCGMCKMKCSQGEVTMKNNQVLSETDIKAGFILTCQSLPQTTTIALQNQ